MRRVAIYAAMFWILLFTLLPRVFGQPRFEVPLRVSDGIETATLYFGILPDAHRCINMSDCFNDHCEVDLMYPLPPAGVFDARFLQPVGCPPSLGSPCDFQSFTSSAQRDTFRFRAQVGAGGGITVCWPAGLSSHFAQLTVCGVDALRDTCTSCESGLIFSSGLVMSAVEESVTSDFPTKPILFQNYPNPFNPSTTFSFTIPVPSFVVLKVYDVLGREVGTVIEGEQQAGEHSVQWKPEGFASGIYIARVTTTYGTSSKALILVR